jgi:large subunit ribosomal protein L24
MSMMRIKKNDTVKVISGKDKGNQGQVIDVLSKKGKVSKVRIQGLGLVVRHAKARKQGETSSIKKIETYFDVSKVMPICTACKKPCRLNATIIDGKKARMCNRCKEVF